MTLTDRLVERIRATGPIGFDEFMESALYDPLDGFYARGRGPGADFVTSPTISPLFGASLAVAVTACHREMGSPARFTLCDVGAGTGALVADLLGAAADAGAPWLGDLEVVLVERGPMDVRPGFSAYRDLAGVAPFEGVLLANELLDNLRVRLLAETGEEVRVSEHDGRLVLVPQATGHCVDPVGIRTFLDEVARVLARGYAVLVDYGKRGGSVRTFAGHRLGEDLLESPGERDVTASVDWRTVEEEAERRGLMVLGRRSQRETLMRLGLPSALGVLREAEMAAVRAEDIWESLRMRDRRTRARALLDPSGPGGFDVLVLGRGVPAGVPWEGDKGNVHVGRPFKR